MKHLSTTDTHVLFLVDREEIESLRSVLEITQSLSYKLPKTTTDKDVTQQLSDVFEPIVEQSIKDAAHDAFEIIADEGNLIPSKKSESLCWKLPIEKHLILLQAINLARMKVWQYFGSIDFSKDKIKIKSIDDFVKLQVMEILGAWVSLLLLDV